MGLENAFMGVELTDFGKPLKFNWKLGKLNIESMRMLIW